MYAGIVIYNQESSSDADEGVVGERSLKLCTFKVAEFARGSRLGELYLRKALWYALNDDFDSVYFTAYTKQTALIGLCISLGFEVSGTARVERKNNVSQHEKGNSSWIESLKNCSCKLSESAQLQL